MLDIPANVIEDATLRDRLYVFADRPQAGRALADLAGRLELSRPLVLGIPRGGVPVASEIAGALGGSFDIVVARKLQIPGNPEAGFGALTADGPVLLNTNLVEALGLTPDVIDDVERRAREEVRRRERVFYGGRPRPSMRGRSVVVVDDGLASGMTMRAAVEYVRSQSPLRLTVAVPTGHFSSVAELALEVDEVVCLNIRGGYSFAVAQAYRNWRDLDDDEVIDILRMHWGPGAETA